MAQDFSELTRLLSDLPRRRLEGRQDVEIRPGSRPAPEPKYEPSDHETTIAVLEGRQTPKVCPYCGRPWNPGARCVCQEPTPYVSPWARVWRWLVALVSPKPPLVIYSDELPRPQPIPRPAAALRGPTRQPPPKPTVRERLVVWVESSHRVPNMPEQVFDEAWPTQPAPPRPPPSVRPLKK